jgi:hypothetical protein
VNDIVKSQHLRRTVSALLMSNPFALAARFDSVNHCVEASNCGAAALRKYRIDARAILCSLVVDGAGGAASAGHNVETVFEFNRTHVDGFSMTLSQFKETAYAAGFPRDPYPFHVIIEARHAGDRAIIDPTLGQLRRQGLPVPLHVVTYGSGWPDLELVSTGTRVTYDACPYPRKVMPEARSYVNAGYTGDLLELMKTAAQCNLDDDAFHRVLRTRSPGVYVKTLRMIAEAVQ